MLSKNNIQIKYTTLLITKHVSLFELNAKSSIFVSILSVQLMVKGRQVVGRECVGPQGLQEAVEDQEQRPSCVRSIRQNTRG